MNALRSRQFGLSTLVTVVVFAALLLALYQLDLGLGLLGTLVPGGLSSGRVIGTRLSGEVVRNRTIGGVIGSSVSLGTVIGLEGFRTHHFWHDLVDISFALISSVVFGGLLGV